MGGRAVLQGSGSHLDLGRAPYVLYGVKYIDLVSPRALFRPGNMPSDPSKNYKHQGWQGYVHWLGTGANTSPSTASVPAPVRHHTAAGGVTLLPEQQPTAHIKPYLKPHLKPKTFLPFDEAHAFAISLDLKSVQVTGGNWAFIHVSYYYTVVSPTNSVKYWKCC